MAFAAPNFFCASSDGTEDRDDGAAFDRDEVFFDDRVEEDVSYSGMVSITDWFRELESDGEKEETGFCCRELASDSIVSQNSSIDNSSDFLLPPDRLLALLEEKGSDRSCPSRS